MEVEVVVDRIENGIAVLEVAGEFVDWPVSALPSTLTEGSRMTFVISGVEGSGQEDAQARLERLRATGPSGDDIDL